MIWNASSFSGRLWRCHCWTGQHSQLRWSVESQQHYLHCHQILVLPGALGHPGPSAGPDLGIPLCLPVLLPHMGHSPLRQELPDGSPVPGPVLRGVRPYLLRSNLRSHGEGAERNPRRAQKGSLIKTYGLNETLCLLTKPSGCQFKCTRGIRKRVYCTALGVPLENELLNIWGGGGGHFSFYFSCNKWRMQSQRRYKYRI